MHRGRQVKLDATPKLVIEEVILSAYTDELRTWEKSSVGTGATEKIKCGTLNSQILEIICKMYCFSGSAEQSQQVTKFNHE